MTAASTGRRGRVPSWLALATVAALVSLAHGACSYSPNIESGSLFCSPAGECPRGFSCATSGARAGRCVTGVGTSGGGGTSGGAGGTIGGVGGSSGFPDGGGIGTPGSDAKADFRLDAAAIDLTLPGTGGAGGGGGAGMPSAIAASYIGKWVFDSAAYVYNDCGPNYATQTSSLAGTTLQIYATTKGANMLGAAWSVWPACTYDLLLDSTGLHLVSDSGWSCEDTTADPAVYWDIYSFDVTTTNGLSATHEGTYLRGYFYADGTDIYCDQLVHAAMNRQ